MTKLIKVSTDPSHKHKFIATFKLDNDKLKTVPFGKYGSNSYIDGASESVRDAYLKRHQKDLKTNDPLKAGYLSYYITWSGFSSGFSKDVNKNIEMYKSKFNL